MIHQNYWPFSHEPLTQKLSQSAAALREATRYARPTFMRLARMLPDMNAAGDPDCRHRAAFLKNQKEPRGKHRRHPVPFEPNISALLPRATPLDIRTCI